jgi:hypothetical protein
MALGAGGGYDDGEEDSDDEGYGQQQQMQMKKKHNATREAEERAQRAYIYSKEVNQDLREVRLCRFVYRHGCLLLLTHIAIVIVTITHSLTPNVSSSV